MLDFIFRSLGGSFLRTTGRFLAYLLLAFIGYFIFSKLKIDWSWLIQ